jgi:hypothetical protein
MNGIGAILPQAKAIRRRDPIDGSPASGAAGHARSSEAKRDELISRVEWETRVFEERQKTIGYVCEVPVLIEQRLFALARAIAQSLE